MPKNKPAITGSGLKLIAMVCMLMDHFAAIYITNYMIEAQDFKLRSLMLMLRSIGRIAFPIFCFLLVEGFIHTHSRIKYAINLLIFALISEIPFNLGFRGSIFAPDYQNVFFTLLIGLLSIMGADYLRRKKLHFAVSLIAPAIGMLAATLLKTDYKWYGVAAIAIMYYFIGAGNNEARLAVGIIPLLCSSLLEAWAFIGVALVACYNGKRGINLKYLFYLFYPVHILLIYLLTYKMGYIGFSIK